MENKSAYFTEIWKLGFGKTSFFSWLLTIFLMLSGSIIYLARSPGFPLFYPIILVYTAVLSYILFLVIIQLSEI